MLTKLSASLFAILAFNLVFFSQPIPFPGTYGSAALILTTLATIFLLSPTRFTKPTKTLLLTTTLTLIFTTFSLLVADPFKRFIFSFTSLGLAGTTLYLSLLSIPKLSFLSEIALAPLRLTLNWLNRAFYFVFQLLPTSLHLLNSKVTPPNPNSINTGGIFRGLIITIPISFIVLVLLASDPAFDHILQGILNFKLPEFPYSWLNRLLASSLIALATFVTGLISLKPLAQSPLATRHYAKHTTEAHMLTGTLIFILGAFLVVQFPYLFTNVSEQELHQFGVQTYSEYVRRGFVELSLVSLIVYTSVGISYLVFRARQSFGRHSHQRLLWLNTILLTQTLIFILSIFRRVYLYTAAHGFTLIRIYGSLFLIMVIGLTLVLALRHLKTKFAFNWFYLELAIILLAIVSPLLIRPERLVLANPPTVNHQVDYTYLSRLSADGVDGWITSYQHSQDWLNQHPEILTTYVLSDDQYNQVNYHFFSLRDLQHNYYELARIYDSADLLGVLNQGAMDPRLNSTEPIDQPWYTTNPAEKSAYTHLKSAIHPQKLVELHNTYSDILATHRQHSTQSNQPLDRSFDSPLAR